MSILNRPSDGLLTVVIVLYKYLLFNGPTAQDRLILLCAPTSPQISDSKQVKQTLNTWLDLGLFIRTSAGEITIAADRPPGKNQRQALLGSLPCTLRRLVMSPDNNPLDRFWEAEQSRAADFTRAVAWALAQNPLSLPSDSYEAMERQSSDQLEPGCRVFQNDTRWSGFKSWAPYLGFAWDSPCSPTLMIDPTVSIREALPTVFGGDAELPVTHFVERLAEALPVLDGGTYRRAVQEKMKRELWTPPKEYELSISFSLALDRLTASNHIRLHNRADAPHKRTKLNGRGETADTLSHVERGKAR